MGDLSRRDFLARFGLGAAATGAAVVAGQALLPEAPVGVSSGTSNVVTTDSAEALRVLREQALLGEAFQYSETGWSVSNGRTIKTGDPTDKRYANNARGNQQASLAWYAKDRRRSSNHGA